jgi:hypothetical protein
MKRNYLIQLTALSLLLLTGGFILSNDEGMFTRLVIPGILVLAVIHLITFLIMSRNTTHDNPNYFIRAVMGGTFLKFFLCIIAVGLLLFSQQKQLHKPDLYVLMFVYVVYTVLETITLSRMARIKN